MASWRAYLVNEGYEKIADAENLEDNLSKDDPEEEPFRSLYKARELYTEVRKALKKCADKRRPDEDFELLWAVLELRLGVNFLNTEEKSTGEEHIEKCLEKLEQHKMSAKGMGIYHDALNQMGILWTGRNKPDEALNYFKQAEQLYVDFKNKVGGAPLRAEDFLHKPREDMDKVEFDRSARLESTYTHTLFYFAQVYQQLGEKDISAQYIHETLQRQLDSHNLDPLDWSLHAATLSQYYITMRDFDMSRHCLASSEVIFQQAEANADQASEEMKEKIEQGKADLQRCWVKYGLGILEYSREMLFQEEETKEGETESTASNNQESQSISEGSASSDRTDATNETPEETVAKANEAVDSNAEDGSQASAIQRDTAVVRKKVADLKFNLEVSSHEDKITNNPVKTFDEAKGIFIQIKKWIEEAKNFYKFDAHCNDYVAIVQDHSLAFKFLSTFEPDLQRQCQMHKRRIDMLGEVLKELNPQHYLLVNRQLMFEIADTYSSMMDLKLAILEASRGESSLTPHNLKKINLLVSESIKYYQEYLNTLKGGKPVYPDEFPENDVRPGLIAFFCMGRLYSKFIPVDVQTRLLNIKKSKECYQFMVDYCERNPSAVPLVETELELCKEMVLLLPAKMQKIQRDSLR